MRTEKDYSPKYFKDTFPEWKKKKDSWLLRHFYRPISFWGASIAYHVGLTSNRVSFISLFVALIGCACFLLGSFSMCMTGCVVITLWMILDCIDGNLARGVKSYPYGEFIDAISSYTLLAFLFPCLSVAVYYNGGAIIKQGDMCIIVIGAFASIFDTVARLYYQKYRVNSYDYISLSKEHLSEGIAPNKKNKLLEINDRINKEIGLNGLMIPWLYLATLTNTLDLAIFFYFIYHLGTLVVSLLVLIKKSGCLKK